MKRKYLIVARIAAVVSSAALLGLYVSCRAGGAGDAEPEEPQTDPGERPVLSGSKSAAVFRPPPQSPPSRSMMSGSKSAPVELTRPKAPAQPQDGGGGAGGGR
jgi:hypothetical protein